MPPIIHDNEILLTTFFDAEFFKVNVSKDYIDFSGMFEKYNIGIFKHWLLHYLEISIHIFQFHP